MRWLMPGAWPSSTCCSLASSANRVEAFSYFAVWWSSRLRNGPGRCEVFGASGRGPRSARGRPVLPRAADSTARYPCASSLPGGPPGSCGHSCRAAGPAAPGATRYRPTAWPWFFRISPYGCRAGRAMGPAGSRSSGPWARRAAVPPAPAWLLCAVPWYATWRWWYWRKTWEKRGGALGVSGWAAVRSIHSMASAYLGSLDFASACTSAATKRRIQKRRRSARSRELTEFETIQFPLSARLGGALHLHGERHAPGFALRDVLDDRQLFRQP